MNNKLDNITGGIFKTVLLATMLFLPLIFWNLTTEFYETPKFIALALVIIVLLITWGVRLLGSGKVTLTRTPLDLPLIIFLLILIISTVFAPAQAVSIIGNMPRVSNGLLASALYILLYFLLISNIKDAATVRRALYLMVVSAIVLSILSLLSFFGANVMPWGFTKSVSFTPSGSNFSTTALLALSLPILLVSLLRNPQDKLLSFGKLFLSSVLALFGATIALTGTFSTYAASSVAIALVLFAVSTSSIRKNLIFLAIPLIVTLMVVISSFVAVGGAKNPIYSRVQSFPREVQLPPDTTWKIAISSFRDSPIWGSGPASFLMDFTLNKPLEFNSNKYWNVRFDQGFNEYLQILATLGGAGVLALLLVTLIFIRLALKNLTFPHSNIGLSLAISGIIFFILLTLHPANLVLWTIGIITLALFMVIHKDLTDEVNIGIAATSRLDKQIRLHFTALPTLLLIVLISLAGALAYFGGRFALADYHHRNAVNNIALGQGSAAYNELLATEQLNPFVDLYRTDLAQTNYVLANTLALTKGPSQSSPSGTLTDQDKQNIQTLLSQAITEGRVAVVLNPNNPNNWEILGSIYRQISGVAQNALEFSLDSYGHAIQRDPFNPILRVTVGGIYQSVKNYDQAIRFFTDAANLKPDYANAYFNLAVALRDRGNLSDAAVMAEKTISLLDPKSSDYQVASKLLSDLKAQQATGSASASNVVTDQNSSGLQNEAKASSALQNKNLPKLLDQTLSKPVNIATPPAVSK